VEKKWHDSVRMEVRKKIRKKEREIKETKTNAGGEEVQRDNI
jgi:hypothetical protein